MSIENLLHDIVKAAVIEALAEQTTQEPPKPVKKKAPKKAPKKKAEPKDEWDLEDEAESEPELTYDDIKAAIVAYQKKTSPEQAQKLFKQHAGDVPSPRLLVEKGDQELVRKVKLAFDAATEALS